MSVDLSPVLNSLDSFKRLVQQAYPARSDVAGVALDGTFAQAWLSMARLLGVSTSQLAAALGPVMGVRLAGSLDNPEAAALDSLSSNYCQTNHVLPLRLEAGALVVATADPLNDSLREKTTFLANRSVRWVLAPPDLIDDAVMVAFAARAVHASDDQRAKSAQALAIDENAITRLGRALLLDAIAQRASDLHIQPFMGSAVARVRIDGALRRLTMLTDAVAATLIRHFKAQSGMEPTNMQVPQDGRMSLVVDGCDFDLRVSTLPSRGGERLVIRFLDQSRVHRLSGAGFSHAALQMLRKSIARPSGMVLITGPTGCGKTSTLYAMLAELNRISVNIITVENPVEYRIAGISQVEVNDKAGRSFHTALRSILRQDPDVILIGEIRDAETAEIAAQAALTGHLVLSTLHTNDALTAIPRLRNLGVEPSILADSLAAVSSQRLCRVLCAQCKVPATDPLNPEEQLFTEITRNRPAHRAVGCRHCSFTGYRGRLPIVEIFLMNNRLRAAVAAGESRLSELETYVEDGLRSLAASGAQRVISGDTTVREVIEVVGPVFWPELARHFNAAPDKDFVLPELPQDVAGQAVLLIGTDPDLAKRLAPALDEQGLRLVVAASAEEAKVCLQKDEDILFIIGDLDERTTLQQAIELARDNRQHISWARLPSVLLLPQTLAAQASDLQASGVMASCLLKPVQIDALVGHIRLAHSR
jgi:type II secretory ATPase GspE/PulE/Tfp pilus assembly ATPase PilB-like protein